jgi:arsenite methyltransferase
MKQLRDDLPLWSAPFGLVLLDTVNCRKGINVLDIGSGSGFPMLELAERLGNTCTVFGIEPDPAARKVARAKIRLRQVRNAKIINVSAEKLPFRNDYFDLIVSNNGMNNVQDEKAALTECFRVASPGCQAVFTMNLPGSLSLFYSLFEQTLSDLGLEHEIRRMKEHIKVKRKTVQAWKKEITDTGFIIQSVKEDLFSMKFSDGDSFLDHSFIRTAFLPSWENLLPTERIPEVVEVLTETLNRKAKEDGSLNMQIPFACYDCQKITE